jgi:UDP-N-acetylmuramyl pentapeptide phosphotransferase/UDP-N-acetylglucosamine-1-phosphate transferase
VLLLNEEAALQLIEELRSNQSTGTSQLLGGISSLPVVENTSLRTSLHMTSQQQQQQRAHQQHHHHHHHQQQQQQQRAQQRVSLMSAQGKRRKQQRGTNAV